MPTVARRSEPLTLRVGTRELTLRAAEVSLLIEVAESWSAGVAPGLDVRHVGFLTETLAVAPSRFGDPPLELDHAQLELLRRVLAETAGGEGGLTPALGELRTALERTR